MRICSIPGCGRKHKAKGWCFKHYMRMKRSGDPLIISRERSSPVSEACSVPGCNRKHWGKGYCSLHYNKKRYEENRQEILEAAKKYRRENPEKVKKLRMESGRKMPARYSRAKCDAKCKKKEWNISFEIYEKLIDLGCYYCRDELGCLKEEIGIGLDRRDNSIRDYNIKNVVPCCGPCNRIRGNDLTVEETKVAILAVLSLRKNQTKSS